MTVLEIRKYGDPVLREKATPFAEVTAEVRQLAADMGETMYAANGLGLAGNQIGVAKRILVLDVADVGEREDDGKRRRPPEKHLEVYLNAEIVGSSDEDSSYNEGCLSIPGIEGDVFRPVRIRLRWMDLDGQTHEQEFDDLRARVLQHEVDHLDGVLFVDRMGTIDRKLLAGRLNRMKQQTATKLGVNAEA